MIFLLSLSACGPCNFPQKAIIDDLLHGDFPLDAGFFLHLFEKVF